MIVSLFEFWGKWTASGPLPADTLGSTPNQALIWIKRPGTAAIRRVDKPISRTAELAGDGQRRAGHYNDLNNKNE
jgi:hypothetical protein